MLNCTAMTKHVGNKVTKIELAVERPEEAGVRALTGRAQVSQLYLH